MMVAREWCYVEAVRDTGHREHEGVDPDVKRNGLKRS
jgi:hypothetical protein